KLNASCDRVAAVVSALRTLSRLARRRLFCASPPRMCGRARGRGDADVARDGGRTYYRGHDAARGDVLMVFRLDRLARLFRFVADPRARSRELCAEAVDP